jgi:hypothetical protein
VLVSWPAFTTAEQPAGGGGQHGGDGGADGFLSVNLAPNGGESGGAVLHGGLSSCGWDGEYAVLGGSCGGYGDAGAVQAQLMPAAQAVQAVSKAYVDQAIAELSGGGSGGY